MTRKDYEIIAKAISQATDTQEKHLVHKDQLLTELVCKLKADNQAFDGFRFIKACE